MIYGFAIFLLSINNIFCMTQSTPIQKISIQYSKPKHDKVENDYTIEAFANKQLIGHVTYSPSKNPYLPEGTWTIKSIRVAKEYQNQKIGFNLFSKAIRTIQKTSARVISINAIPRLESPMTPETLVSIYFKMIEKYDPQLAKATIIRPYPSDENYKQIIIQLKK